MKKTVILLMMLALFVGNSVTAVNCADGVTCKEEYDLTPSYSRFFSHITGNNFLAEKIAQSVIRKNIKKTVDGDINVKIKSYSARDMRAGRFKSFEVNGKNVQVEGVSISKFSLKTICDFNYIHIDKDWNMTVMDDVPMQFDIVITQDDLNKTMASQDYMRMLSDVNKLGGGIFSIESTNLKIKHNKIYYVMKIAVPFVRKTQDVVICTGLKVTDGEIEFADAKILNKEYALNVDKITKILNYVNPLDFSVKILENKDAKLTIKNVSIEDNKISADGILLLLKENVK